MPEDAPRPAQAAIRTDLGAIFVSLELSRRAWLITSLSPGGGEKMSKHSVPASDVSGLLRRFAELVPVALLAALVSAAQGKARDDVAEMFCRRVATLTKRARAELEALREAHRAMTERLIANYRAVLERIGYFKRP